MAIDVSTADGATIITLIGRLDSNSSTEAERAVNESIDDNTNRMVLDFTDLDYISSAGLRVVLIAAKRIKAAKGKLALFGMQPHVKEVFEMSGFLAILTVTPDRATAVAAVTA